MQPFSQRWSVFKNICPEVSVASVGAGLMDAHHVHDLLQRQPELDGDGLRFIQDRPLCRAQIFLISSAGWRKKLRCLNIHKHCVAGGGLCRFRGLRRYY